MKKKENKPLSTAPPQKKIKKKKIYKQKYIPFLSCDSRTLTRYN